MQQVLSNLLISHIELRTEESKDIKQYSFDRQVDKIIVPDSKEIAAVKDRYVKVSSWVFSIINEFKAKNLYKGNLEVLEHQWN